MANYKNVLAPVDGSTFAEKSFNEGIDIAKRNDATLHIINAVNDYRSYDSVGNFQTLYDELKDEAQKLLDDYSDQAKKAGVKNVITEVLLGDPRTEICSYQESRNCDLVVIGSSGKSGLERVLVGSVCEYTVSHATCNVLVIR